MMPLVFVATGLCGVYLLATPGAGTRRQVPPGLLERVRPFVPAPSEAVGSCDDRGRAR